MFVNKGPIDFTIMKEPLRRPCESSRLYATYASVGCLINVPPDFAVQVYSLGSQSQPPAVDS